VSNDPRPDSQKSRQDLLDEIYYLRDVAGEREQQVLEYKADLAARDGEVASLRQQLSLLLNSRSWRLTAPLRWVSRTASGQHLAVAKPASGATGGLNKPGERGPITSAPSADAVVTEDRSDGKPRLYVDVTELVLRQGRTGVQRVACEILRALLREPPHDYQVQPVFAPVGQHYRCVSPSTIRSLASPSRGLGENGAVIDDGDAAPTKDLLPESGDVFLGLDHAMDAVISNAHQIAAMRYQGVRIWFVCNDVLPLVRPEWFSSEIPPKFKTWIETIARLADGVACISAATESELRSQLEQCRADGSKAPKLGHFHLGADALPSERDDTGIPPEESAVVERLCGTTSFLMVGTLEPRKGHAQALQAFEMLWAEGTDIALVIAGFPGWMTEVLQRRIRHHNEFGKRLFWFSDASDALLRRLYESCTVLLAPSFGEGFGLPLLEAARHNLPILCRDLPVFREVAGEHAVYFSGSDPESLTGAIRSWLDAGRHGAIPASGQLAWLGWRESARQMAALVLGNQSGRTQ